MSGIDPRNMRVTAIVRGRVQGVGYRFFARREASALGLRGYARNRVDGGVEVVAEGARRNLETFVELLRRGPSSAEVEAVDVTWSVASETFANFGIRH
ncbi:MAG: acylphosphatase [Ktedonobacterales bacterium]